MRLTICLFARFFPPYYSGAGGQAANVAAALVEAGLKVQVLTPLRDPRHSRQEIRQGVNIRRVPGPWNSYRLTVLCMTLLQIVWVLRGWRKWDVLLFFAIGTDVYLPIVLGRLLGKRVVIRVSQLGTDDLESIKKHKFGKLRIWFLSWAHATVCTTDRILEACQRALSSVPSFRCPPRCLRIPNGVDTGRFLPQREPEKREKLRKELGLQAANIIGIFVGYVDRRKAVHRLIREWAIVEKNIGHSRLLIVGPRSLSHVGISNQQYVRELDHLVEQLGLIEVVHWIETNDVVPLLQASDVFVFASRQEGLPNAVLEAMACGLPVFVIRHEWLPEDLVVDRTTGYVVDNVPSELGQRVSQEWGKPDLEEVAQSARQHICARFDLKSAGAAYQALFQSLKSRTSVPELNRLYVNA